MARDNGQTLGRGQIPGSILGDSALSGNVGELLSSSVASGSAVSLSNGVLANLTSVSLTAGDWDVCADAYFKFSGTTVLVRTAISISPTSAVDNLVSGFFGDVSYPTSYAPQNAGPLIVKAGPARVSLSTTTTYYAVAYGEFGTSTLTVFGTIRARRVR